MIRLDTFTRTTNGFFGQITTFLMEDDLSILPIEDPATENTPDYRVLRGLEDDAIQVGCTWARQGERIGLWLAMTRFSPAPCVPGCCLTGTNTTRSIWSGTVPERRRDPG